MKLNNISIKIRISLIPGLILIFLFGMLLLSLFQIRNQRNSINSLYSDSYLGYKNKNKHQLAFKSLHENLFRLGNYVSSGFDDSAINSVDENITVLIEKFKLTIDTTNQTIKDSVSLQYLTWLIRARGMLKTDISMATSYLNNADLNYTILDSINSAELDELDIQSKEQRDQSLRSYRKSITIFITLSILVLLVSVALTIILIQSIMIPFGMLIKFLRNITAQGWNLTQRMSVNGTDEIAELTQWINDFIDKLANILKNIYEQSTIFNNSTKKLSLSTEAISGHTQKMVSEATSVTSSTAEMKQKIDTISEATDSISKKINNVTNSIETMSSALNNIVQQCQHESDISSIANSKAQSSTEFLEKLSASAGDIGSIVKIIRDVASQTNLLALNASIEAASAGEAGKGFAIVAYEIKELAKKTNNAITEVNTKISEIQDNTKITAESIQEIITTIGDIDTTSQGIVESVEVQSTTIQNISQNMTSTRAEASAIVENVSTSVNGIAQVNTSMQSVNGAISGTTQKLQQIQQDSEALSNLAHVLSDIVSQFKF